MTRSTYESSGYLSKEMVQSRDSALVGLAALILQGLWPGVGGLFLANNLPICLLNIPGDP